MEFLIFLKNFLKNYCGEQAGAGGCCWLGGVGYFSRWNSQKSTLKSIFSVIFRVFQCVFVLYSAFCLLYLYKTNYFCPSLLPSLLKTSIEKRYFVQLCAILHNFVALCLLSPHISVIYSSLYI